MLMMYSECDKDPAPLKPLLQRFLSLLPPPPIPLSSKYVPQNREALTPRGWMPMINIRRSQELKYLAWVPRLKKASCRGPRAVGPQLSKTNTFILPFFFSPPLPSLPLPFSLHYLLVNIEINVFIISGRNNNCRVYFHFPNSPTCLSPSLQTNWFSCLLACLSQVLCTALPHPWEATEPRSTVPMVPSWKCISQNS